MKPMVSLAEQRIKVANVRNRLAREQNKLARMLAACKHGSILKLVSSGDSRYQSYCRICEQYLPAEPVERPALDKSGLEQS